MPASVATTPLGKVAFGTVQEPRLNQLSNKLEWTIGMIFSMEEAAPLLAAVEEALVEAMKTRPKVKATPQEKLNLPYKPAQILKEDGTKAKTLTTCCLFSSGTQHVSILRPVKRSGLLALSSTVLMANP